MAQVESKKAAPAEKKGLLTPYLKDAPEVALPVSQVLIFTSPPGGAIDPNGALAASLPQATTLGFQQAVNVSSAQLLALGTTPIQILPPLPANQYYQVTNVAAYYIPGSIAYVSVGPPKLLYYTTGVPAPGSLAFSQVYDNLISSLVGLGTQFITVDGVQSPVIDSTSAPLGAASYLGQPVALASAGGSLTTGNGTMRFVVNYLIRTSPVA